MSEHTSPGRFEAGRQPGTAGPGRSGDVTCHAGVRTPWARQEGAPPRHAREEPTDGARGAPERTVERWGGGARARKPFCKKID